MPPQESPRSIARISVGCAGITRLGGVSKGRFRLSFVTRVGCAFKMIDTGTTRQARLPQPCPSQATSDPRRHHARERKWGFEVTLKKSIDLGYSTLPVLVPSSHRRRVLAWREVFSTIPFTVPRKGSARTQREPPPLLRPCPAVSDAPHRTS